MKITERISELLGGLDFPTKVIKGANSVKNEGRVTSFNLAYNLIMLHICYKFRKKYFNRFQSY